jgi:hypothetical protein
LQLIRQHFERQRARDLARVVASETVGYGKDKPVLARPAADRVLVTFAHTAGVGEMEKIDFRHNRMRAHGLPSPPKRRGEAIDN